jgi:hypothetical protein
VSFFFGDMVTYQDDQHPHDETTNVFGCIPLGLVREVSGSLVTVRWYSTEDVDRQHQTGSLRLVMRGF